MALTHRRVSSSLWFIGLVVAVAGLAVTAVVDCRCPQVRINKIKSLPSLPRPSQISGARTLASGRRRRQRPAALRPALPLAPGLQRLACLYPLSLASSSTGPGCELWPVALAVAAFWPRACSHGDRGRLHLPSDGGCASPHAAHGVHTGGAVRRCGALDVPRPWLLRLLRSVRCGWGRSTVLWGLASAGWAPPVLRAPHAAGYAVPVRCISVTRVCHATSFLSLRVRWVEQTQVCFV